MGGECHAQSVYAAALLEYSNGIRDSFSTAMHPHKWWSTLKTFLFDVNTSLPPIWTDDGFVTYDPSKMAKVPYKIFRRDRTSKLSANKYFRRDRTKKKILAYMS